ncbi:uncharacterized protein LOC127011037 isoform X2 [Drosophila biarmipes]|uniref:uncharacterized protein LOC127011037 isoform X2 n=1 Tax=Drosophila biarmipes TaxID=125945 RepID=UPI0021CD1346|nr:uncharacterized protein LOC127011037 isoform X2 [Drosophila biarmipes]
MSNKGNEDSQHHPGLEMEEQQASDQATDEGRRGEDFNSPTSEVGFGSNQTFYREVFALLEQQNRNFLELVKKLQTPANELQQTSEIFLPKYNPDVVALS